MPPLFATYNNIQGYVKAKVRLRWRHPRDDTAVVIRAGNYLAAHGPRGVNHKAPTCPQSNMAQATAFLIWMYEVLGSNFFAGRLALSSRDFSHFLQTSRKRCLKLGRRRFFQHSSQFTVHCHPVIRCNFIVKWTTKYRWSYLRAGHEGIWGVEAELPLFLTQF